MRPSRTDLVPVLTIMAGGAIGCLFTFSPLGFWSPADDGPAQMTTEARVGPVVIASVEVEGNTRQSDLTIISMGGLNAGSTATVFDIQRALKSMWATGQFKDIRVRVKGDVDEGRVTLIWEVDEEREDPTALRLDELARSTAHGTGP